MGRMGGTKEGIPMAAGDGPPQGPGGEPRLDTGALDQPLQQGVGGKRRAVHWTPPFRPWFARRAEKWGPDPLRSDFGPKQIRQGAFRKGGSGSIRLPRLRVNSLPIPGLPAFSGPLDLHFFSVCGFDIRILDVPPPAVPVIVGPVAETKV